MKKLLCVLMLGVCVQSMALAESKKAIEKEDPYLLMDLLGATFEQIKKDSVEDITYRQMVEKSINGVLTSLDPHSGFLDLQETQEMETQTKGEFGGLGLEVSSDKDLVRITSPIDDTPAAKAGLQAGDYISHIDGVSVVGMSLNDAVKKMRGKPKTKIKLGIYRKNKKPFTVTLTRDIIKVQSVKFEAKGDVGYIRISTFSDGTGDKVKQAIKDLTKTIGSDKLKGFVLDLRNNPGGLLDEAVAVSDLFLDKGEIVSTRSRAPEDTLRFSAKEGDETKGLPLVVLINEGSASASEIVSGALQDHKRAVVAGLKSFGKGSVQSVRQIPGFGSIKLTTARYYTPSGNSIQAKGITPDVEIPRAKLEVYPVLTGYSEENLEGALDLDHAPEAKNPFDEDEQKDKKETEKTDYQLDRALDLVRGIWVANQREG